MSYFSIVIRNSKLTKYESLAHRNKTERAFYKKCNKFNGTKGVNSINSTTLTNVQWPHIHIQGIFGNLELKQGISVGLPLFKASFSLPMIFSLSPTNS